MSDWMEIDPQALRPLADQHDRVAADTLEWARPPREWLDNFLPTYGKIAYPVYTALERYYDARERAGKRLAGQHQQTAAALRAAADAYEQTDADIARQVQQAGDPDSAGTAPSPVATAPGATTPGTVPAATTPLTTAGAGESGSVSSPVNNGLGNAAVPTGGAAAPDAAQPGASSTPAAAAAASPTGPVAAVAPTDPASTAGSAAGTPPAGPPAGSAPPAGPMMPPPMVPPVVSGAPAGGGTTSGGDGTPPMTPMAPFANALNNARDKAAEPNFVVGDAPDDDLILARTLLGGILSAVGSAAVGLQWAVSVLRGPGGAMVLVTSNEGRGWLPAGVYLPEGTTVPWTVEGTDAAWEGITDPARVLAEFAMMAGPRSGVRLTALVSSTDIDPAIQARFGDVSMQSAVPPTDDVDLSVPTDDTVDRLALAGWPNLQDKVAAVADDKLRDRAFGLAADANTRIGHTTAATPEAAVVRRLRDNILTELQQGRQIPRDWWDELRDADDLLAATMLSRRVDVRRVDLGDLRLDDHAETLRALVFERRCDELLMLLAEDVTRQDLRDAVYAHVQIMGHPLYSAAPETVVAPEIDTAAREEVLVSEADLVAPDADSARTVVTAGVPLETAGVAAPPTGAAVPPTVIAPETGRGGGAARNG
ncbi:hypothetical protein HLB23_06295 [Nocardia uniformis]|uniref:Uncharacterized protein n=1 Tax=Nocardia uniformis TaxID=53432 RepID=A0A849BS74_9NOCA|nr:type VII secretion target [Nocardia uniformis]NNH69482.1 hypothetical protein [Nocardia uniformis]